MDKTEPPTRRPLSRAEVWEIKQRNFNRLRARIRLAFQAGLLVVGAVPGVTAGYLFANGNPYRFVLIALVVGVVAAAALFISVVMLANRFPDDPHYPQRSNSEQLREALSFLLWLIGLRSSPDSPDG